MTKPVEYARRDVAVLCARAAILRGEYALRSAQEFMDHQEVAALESILRHRRASLAELLAPERPHSDARD